MVFFKHYTSSHKNYLSIVEYEKEDRSKGLLLHINPPKYGRFSHSWPKLVDVPSSKDWSIETSKNSHKFILQSTLHESNTREDKFVTLGRRIISGEARWGAVFRINGEFQFVPKYWEWLEDVLIRGEKVLNTAHIYHAVYASLYTYDCSKDIMRAFCEGWCPSTNSLHTFQGELSVSLWDLYKFGGLPVHGKLYEEVIPSSAELTESDVKGKFVPKSCEYLFSAFYHLCGKRENPPRVSVEAWVNFWFKGQVRYSKPPARRGMKSVRPKSTYNPSGVLGSFKNWSREQFQFFEAFNIEAGIRGETYVAAFLSCWLCVFVFPIDESRSIRPETFKVSSLMAVGQTFSLAIPVLATIYRGLNDIAKSIHPGSFSACFPVHYVYGWLSNFFPTHFAISSVIYGPKMAQCSGEGGAKYFDEVEARNLIQNGDKIAWSSNVHTRNRSETLIDNGTLDFVDLSYLVSIRSSYLTARFDDLIIIEPYSPHRFGRQFGFYQDVPGTLKNDIRSGSLDVFVRFWRISVANKTKSKLISPASPLNFEVHISERFSQWWKQVHGTYLKDGVDVLISSCQVAQTKRKNDSARDVNLGSKRKAIADYLFGDAESSAESLKDQALPIAPTFLEKNGDSSFSRGVSPDVYWKRDRKRQNHSPHAPLPKSTPIILESAPAKDGQDAKSSTKDSIIQNKKPAEYEVESLSKITPAKPVGQTSGQQASLPLDVSLFCADDIIHQNRLQLALTMWRSIHQKIIKTSFSQVPSLESEIWKIIDAIGEYRVLDTTPLRTLVEDYILKVKNFNNLGSSLSSNPELETQFEGLEARLDDSSLHSKEINANIVSLQTELAKVDDELKLLKDKRHELITSIKNRKLELKHETVTFANAWEEMMALGDAFDQTDTDSKSLQLLQGMMDEARSNLQHFEWNP